MTALSGKKTRSRGTIGLHQDLRTFAVYLFKLGHKPLEIGGWQGE
jgi:hypothetical protein